VGEGFRERKGVPKSTKDGRLTSRDLAGIQVARIMAWTRIGLATVRWAGIGFLAFMAYKCIQALAGQTTVAAFIIAFIGKLGISRWLAWLIAFLSLGYGANQRRLRLRTLERPDRRMKELRELEEKFDPRRSSSQLDERGRAPREQ
jgi:hypothetical protein